MRSWAMAAGMILTAASAPAQESASPHYSNRSLGGGQAVAAPPTATAAPPVKKHPGAAPPQASPRPTPPPASTPERRLWTVVILAGGALFAAAFFIRRWALLRRRAGDESLTLAAHELKSPLAAIESYLDLMVQEAPKGAVDARRWLEDLQNMRSTAAHLRRTIGSILEMTRVSDGRVKLAPSALDARALLARTAASYEAHARARGIALSVEASDVEVSVLADADRVRQVLDNLVGNALKFTPAGACVRLSARLEDEDAVLEVRDEGIGVPENKRARLFGKFQHLATALDGTAGTGLGLHISRKLMEAQGGRLDFAPGPGGRGSVFKMSLPRAGRP